MANQESKSKATYSVNQLKILLLREAYERDLSLFHKLTTDNSLPKDWTFTVVRTGDKRELFVNTPQQVKK